MRVGLTYDLRDEYLAEGYGEEETAEFDSPATIDAITDVLTRRGVEVDRIGHVRHLAARLVAGDRWEFVFNIAEGLRGIGREAQVPALLDAWDIPYTFSDPLVLALTLDKGMTKRVVRDAGIPTPAFAVVRDSHDARQVDLPYPLFVKPLAEGTGKGISAASRAENPAALVSTCGELIAKFRQPMLVETYLPGREFTVGIAGTGAEAGILGVMEIILTAEAEPFGYSFENKERYEGRVSYRLADDAEAERAGETALRAWRVLGCRDGGRLDLRSDHTGEPNFIEANPLAGLHPVKSDLVILARLAGISYDDLLGRIVDSCLSRIFPVAARAA